MRRWFLRWPVVLPAVLMAVWRSYGHLALSLRRKNCLTPRTPGATPVAVIPASIAMSRIGGEAMRRLTSSLMVIAGLLVLGSAARAVDITECGQVVPEGQVGVLLGDLDCSDPNAAEQIIGVQLEPRATLDLDNFSLHGSSGRGVRCRGACRVNGPGAITGFSIGILVLSGSTVRVTDVSVTGTSGYGILSISTRVILKRCSIIGAGGPGIDAAGKILAIDSLISDNAEQGLSGTKLIIRNSTVTGNGDSGVIAFKGLSARDSVINDNASDCLRGIRCYDIRMEGKRRSIARLRNTVFGSCSPSLRCRSN